MSQFDQLPTEVLLLIIGQIRSNRDFTAFSQTCRFIHDLTKNELALRQKYRRIRIKSRSDFDKGFKTLQSILRRPQLGDYVKHIEFDQPSTLESGYGYYIINQNLKELSDEDSEKLRTAVENTGFTGVDAEKVVNMILRSYDFPWHFGSAEGILLPVWVGQALATLLISVSPYLESMATCLPMFTSPRYHDPDVDIGMRFPLETLLMETNAHPQGRKYLQYLRSVEFLSRQVDAFSDDRFYVDFDLLGMVCFFNRLPSMEYIGVDAIAEDRNGLQDLEPSSSNITRIRIYHSNLRTKFLMPLIYSCKVLREFHYTIGGRATTDRSFAVFNAYTFLKSILGHKTTLEILHIDADDTCDFVNMEGDRNPEHISYWDDEKPTPVPPEGFWERTGSLRDFAVLSQLHVGIGLLLYLAQGIESMDVKDAGLVAPFEKVVLADSLPPTLESLVIIGYERGVREDVDRVIEQFVIEKEAKLPNLKHISGIDEMIERASLIRDLDKEKKLVWKSEDVEWSDYEY